MAERPSRPPNPLSTAGLDRLGLLRKHPDQLADLYATTDVRAVPICGGKVCVSTDSPPRLVHPDVDELEEAWLLGSFDGVTYVALDHGPDEADFGPDARLAGLREVAGMLPALEGNLLAMATGLAIWHDTHRHCGKCGSPTAVDWAGHRRRCDSCGREHFPRTDPAIIVLVTAPDGERALLARNPMWPRGFASVLAGFVEPGESLEDAVAREVKEEVGIDVVSVDYHSSQPWPFPASVMLGFTAEAATDELRPDPEEIADACFYTRDELANGAVGLPPPLSISRRLIDDWIAAGDL